MRLRPTVEEQFWRNEMDREKYKQQQQQQFQCQMAEENFWIGYHI